MNYLGQQQQLKIFHENPSIWWQSSREYEIWFSVSLETILDLPSLETSLDLPCSKSCRAAIKHLFIYYYDWFLVAKFIIITFNAGECFYNHLLVIDLNYLFRLLYDLTRIITKPSLRRLSKQKLNYFTKMHGSNLFRDYYYYYYYHIVEWRCEDAFDGFHSCLFISKLNQTQLNQNWLFSRIRIRLRL